jgi:hypothetical protein
MLQDLCDPAEVPLMGRAARLHPRSLKAQRIKRVLWMGFFFGSLAFIFAFLVWLANRYPAQRPRLPQSYPGETK